jgi:type IV pilus assembly protein PilY1
LINWAIGYDVDDEDKDKNVTEMRPSVHGDIVHSQPVAKDYVGDPDAPEVVVFYGGNDGVLRAINGNQATTHSGYPLVDAGEEFWAFIPPEFYGEIKRLRVNEDTIKFPASGPTAGQGVPGTEPKGYGMDGPLSIAEFDLDDDDNDEIVLFAGMRRASRTLYSFDVTDRSAPTLNWKIGCPVLDPNDPTGCTTDMEEIGQTWSRVAVTYAQGYDPDGDGELDPLLMFGGGYDICEDYDDGTSKNNECTTTKGNAIYLVDAVSGVYVNSWSTDRSVPGKVTVVPMADDDPRIMYAYAADTGGNVYRISGKDQNDDPMVIGSTLPSTWLKTKIASLGCDTKDPCDDNRKFLFGPDVIKVPDSDLIGILVGSGDREKPLRDYGAALGVENHFYVLFDQPTNQDWLDDEAPPICRADIICHDSLATLDPNDLVDGVAPTTKGWKLQLRPGEQVVTGAITVDNVVNFSTHIPTVPDSCDADYGEATAYNIDYADASGGSTEFLGGGLVPTPVAGKVLIDGVAVPFCIGCGSEGSPIGAGKVGGGIDWTQPRSRVFWNIDQVDD